MCPLFEWKQCKMDEGYAIEMHQLLRHSTFSDPQQHATVLMTSEWVISICTKGESYTFLLLFYCIDEQKTLYFVSCVFSLQIVSSIPPDRINLLESGFIVVKSFYSLALSLPVCVTKLFATAIGKIERTTRKNLYKCIQRCKPRIAWLHTQWEIRSEFKSLDEICGAYKMICVEQFLLARNNSKLFSSDASYDCYTPVHNVYRWSSVQSVPKFIVVRRSN